MLYFAHFIHLIDHTSQTWAWEMYSTSIMRLLSLSHYSLANFSRPYLTGITSNSLQGCPVVTLTCESLDRVVFGNSMGDPTRVTHWSELATMKRVSLCKMWSLLLGHRWEGQRWHDMEELIREKNSNVGERERNQDTWKVAILDGAIVWERFT